MSVAERNRSVSSQRSVMLGLGSNLGDSVAAFCSALRFLKHDAGCEIVSLSRVYETLPVGPGSERYTNAAAEITTNLDLHDLMKQCQQAERNAGRIRGVSWGDRPVDIDLLLDGASVHAQVELMVPHRLMHVRRFVLDPLFDVCPEAVHPTVGRSISEMVLHWRQPVLRVGYLGDRWRSNFEELLTDSRWQFRVIQAVDVADLMLGFEPIDVAQWPPAVDLRNWPLEPVAAIEAALASVCDEPVLCELNAEQQTLWQSLGA